MQIKSMTDRDLARYWAQYVKELAVLLVGLEGGAEPPAAIVERIRNLVLRELLFLYIRYEQMCLSLCRHPTALILAPHRHACNMYA